MQFVTFSTQREVCSVTTSCVTTSTSTSTSTSTTSSVTTSCVTTSTSTSTTSSVTTSVGVVNQFPSSGSSSNLSICETAARDLQTRNNPEFYLPRGEIASNHYLQLVGDI